MPKVGCFTGTGAVVAFTPDEGGGPTTQINTFFAPAPKQSVGEVTFEIERLEAPAVSDARLSLMRTCPGDLITHSPFDVMMYFDPDFDFTAVIGQTGEIVRTHPVHTGQNNGTKWTGDGYVTGATIPEEVSNTLSVSTITFSWYGTAPTGETSLSQTPSS